jgi:demethylmenaquinone methyltransferase/2-methoxy-6-polyprenyl-1,4-benzoquinol methylase
VDHLDGLLRDQAAYYRAVAGEYDQAYEQRDELRSLDDLVRDLPIRGDVLELACGTGQWTRLLAARGHRVTAVDAAPEMLAVAGDRVTGLGVEFLRADLFTWQPPRRFDTVFFGFWLSHVPPTRFAAFCELVASALRPGGRACFVDSGPAEEATEEVLIGQSAPAVRRRLKDGSEHRIVKLFPDPAALERAWAAQGWAARVWTIAAPLIVGEATPR